MDIWSTNWGDIATVIGVGISLAGFFWAIRAAHGARAAAREAKDQIVNHLQTVDLQRAIGLIELIKTLHDNDRWEAAREHYQELRAMLSDVIVRCPKNLIAVREDLATARTIIRDMENDVRKRTDRDIGERARARFTERLNTIQSDLEELAGSVSFGDPQGEKK